ncbi:hypothetical protein MSAN_01498600 [Mycena sanguinolenta]|uniref:Uncharacterized protein n=1 Tax=Mycena sanguinolenta TaxID=230812 RepID=A0A8H7CZH4_9AGAR|nr:hypothetical protein MSAN_01498600 [Mycena sanguinolenta]
MDLHPDSEPEFIVVSTSDYADSESTPYVLLALTLLNLKPRRVTPHTSRPTRNVEPFLKSFSFLPSLLRGSFKTSGTNEAHPRKYWETKPRRQATEHTVNKYYSYHITGGFGGSGGEGGEQGGDGGGGQGPTVYFGQPQARESSDFRTIPRGDVKLLKKVRLSTESVVVGRQSRGVGVRRTVYHAKIRGDPETVTVATYKGDGAEEEWQKDVAKYESIWDPRIMQLHGLVSGKGLYAMVFHDELIPYAQFLRRFKHSLVLSTYIIGYCTTEWREATNYISDVFSQPPIEYIKVPGWIQPRSGQLCLDLVQGGIGMGSMMPAKHYHVLRLENVTLDALDAPDSEAIIIASLSEDQYHKICCGYPFARTKWFQVSTAHAVGLGIFRLDSQYGTCVSITEPLQILPEEELHWENYGRAPDELLPNSWIRYDSHQTNTLQLELRLPFSAHGITKAWLAQANCIFAELEETAHVEDYVCIYTVEFTLRIADKRDIPEGYLFVCSPQDFRIGTEPHVNLYQWPACPAYWSLDPSGAGRLSTEDAKNLGFPAIHIETRMHGYSWDHSVYRGLRQFHEGKGFNPDSREVARRLEYPLYEVSSNRVLFPARDVSDRPWPGDCEQDDLALCRSFGHYL